MTLQLSLSDRLVFLADGVPEARNLTGQLLGFEATEQLSALSLDAIANAAIMHGQDDDITVLSLALAPAAVWERTPDDSG